MIACLELSDRGGLGYDFKIGLERWYAACSGVSAGACEVGRLFGLGIDGGDRVCVVKPTPLYLRGGDLVFVTGPSGGGKSTILDLLRAYAVDCDEIFLVELGALQAEGGCALVDCFDDRFALKEVIGLLSLVGLADAFLLLRGVDQLSVGQRFRFDLAYAMSVAMRLSMDGGEDVSILIIADEFCSALDRVTACVVSRNLRRLMAWCGFKNIIFVAATGHDDLYEHLEPDVLIDKGLGCDLDILYRD